MDSHEGSQMTLKWPSHEGYFQVFKGRLTLLVPGKNSVIPRKLVQRPLLCVKVVDKLARGGRWRDQGKNGLD